MSAPPVVELHTRPYRRYSIGGEFEIDGVKIASVTQVLGVIDKSGPLQHYASTQTIEGIVALIRRGKFGMRGLLASEDPALALKDALKKNGLMFYQRTNDAAKRGTTVHQALEDYALHGTIPNPGKVREDWRGYIAGLAKWLGEVRPEFIETERAVGSRRLKVAGTRDTVVRIQGEEGIELCDLKTSKRAYETHFLQLAAYDLLGQEMGEAPADRRAVICVHEDGTWERYPSPVGIEPRHFEAAVGLYRAMEEVRELCKD